MLSPLGLAIGHGGVTAMGGVIRAESPVSAGHGTRTVITLPARTDLSDEPVGAAPFPAGPVAEDELGPAGRMRVQVAPEEPPRSRSG